jgi:Ser/Thr protein kinase RdoA (MazF antagonist)
VTAPANFENIMPDRLIEAVEQATGFSMTGLTSPLPSYINRVYEFQAKDGTRLIGKFYRPGRWSKEAIEEEHQFVLDCKSHEIPVVSPLNLIDGATLGQVDGIHFTVFPKKLGREFEVIEDEDWRRLGRVVARIHVAGSIQKAETRTVLHPGISTANDIRQLTEGGFVTPRHVESFQEIGRQIVESSSDIFDDAEFIRLHGDSHRGNLLYRPQEGIMVIDFDDMMTGPPVQDLWLLLPDHAENCGPEIDLILEGYEMFREFDRRTLKLIEPLRAMRIIYFLAWCSKQANDYKFKTNFPDWGSDGFWQQEINDLKRQLIRIKPQPQPQLQNQSNQFVY